MKISDIQLIIDCLNSSLEVVKLELRTYLDLGEAGLHTDERGEHWTTDSERAWKAHQKYKSLMRAIHVMSTEDW